MSKTPVPFDSVKLDSLLDQEGIDFLLASSRHNTRYLTGGYYNWFHSRIVRAATQRYLSFVSLPRGRLNDAFFVAGLTEGAAVLGRSVGTGAEPHGVGAWLRSA